MTSEEEESSDRALRGALAALAVLALAGLGIWALAPAPSGEPARSLGEPFDGARLVSLAAAGDIARSSGHPVFWAGRLPGLEVAMNRDSRMNVHVRYLPPGVDPETDRSRFFTIGSYPFEGAFEATARLAGEPGRVEIDLPDGVGFFDRFSAPRVVLALEDHPDLQIEVVHPRPEQALAAVRRGAIVPIE